MTIPELDKWEPVMVKWQDSAGGDAGWHKPTRKEQRINWCYTVGMVYRQRNHSLTLVLSRETSFKQVDGLVTIPLVAIKELTRLGG